ncbi:MAG: hypothetical protein WC789_09465 [Lentisphaeria bacterium]
MSDKTERLLANLRAERERQDAKWGEQNHHPFTWLVILLEEVGEAAKAALKGRPVEYHKETVQAAAVAIAALESLERNPGPWPDVTCLQRQLAKAVRLVAHYEAALGRESAAQAYKGALADMPEAVRQSGTVAPLTHTEDLQSCREHAALHPVPGGKEVAQFAEERAEWAERLTAAEQRARYAEAAEGLLKAEAERLTKLAMRAEDFDAGWLAAERREPKPATASADWADGWDYYKALDEVARLREALAVILEQCNRLACECYDEYGKKRLRPCAACEIERIAKEAGR